MSRIYEATQRAAGLGVDAAAPEVPAHPEDPIASFPREQAVPSRLHRVPAPRSVSVPPVQHAETPAPAMAPLVVADRASTGANKLISAGTWTPAFSEYRRLAATLIQAQTDGSSMTMMVTSAVPGEGKTLTAANLALTFARSYSRRVLLVDADMRRPFLHELFGTANGVGLGACLKAGCLLPGAATTLELGLTLLTAGQAEADPVSYLSSSGLQDFIRDVAACFDCVIFDTPPAVLLPDAELMSGAVQSTILVVRSGRTSYRKVERAIEAIGRERIAGVVLNQMSSDAVAAADYSDVHGYGPYAGNGQG